MNDLSNAIWIELRKVYRSKVPLFTLIGFLILPLACAFLMFVYKNPDFAREIGIIGAKANLAGGSADWPFYLSMIGQGVSIGGIILFSFVLSWVFGREFSDGTLKDLLAVPVRRGTILAAKFIVSALWCAVLAAAIYTIGLTLGAMIGLAQGSTGLVIQQIGVVAVTTILVILNVFPVAFFASAGRGYLLPMGIAILILVLANIAALIGWGDYFPWAIPAIFAGLTGEGAYLSAASYWIVAFTGLAGVVGTYYWWKYADQSR